MDTIKDFIVKHYLWLIPVISFLIAGVIIPIAIHISNKRRKSSGDNIKAVIKVNRSKVKGDINQDIK